MDDNFERLVAKTAAYNNLSQEDPQALALNTDGSYTFYAKTKFFGDEERIIKVNNKKPELEWVSANWENEAIWLFYIDNGQLYANALDLDGKEKYSKVKITAIEKDDQDNETNWDLKSVKCDGV